MLLARKPCGALRVNEVTTASKDRVTSDVLPVPRRPVRRSARLPCVSTRAKLSRSRADTSSRSEEGRFMVTLSWNGRPTMSQETDDSQKSFVRNTFARKTFDRVVLPAPSPRPRSKRRRNEAVKAPGIRNGRSAKSAKTDEGGLEIDAPRGRSGGLAPHFLPRRSVPSPDSGAGSSPQSTPSTTRNGSAGAALPRSRSSAGQLSERRRRRLRSRRIERNPAAEMRPPAR